MRRPISVGLNCALGAEQMRAHIADMARVCDTLICAYPNAGLPNEFGHYHEGPEEMARHLGEFADTGLVNIVGGCCGTTPEHISAIAEAVRGKAPRAVPEVKPLLRLSGLEPFTLAPEIPFVNVGERTNVTGSAKFRSSSTAATTRRRWRSRATRSRTARRSSTSTWTRVCSIPPRR